MERRWRHAAYVFLLPCFFAKRSDLREYAFFGMTCVANRYPSVNAMCFGPIKTLEGKEKERVEKREKLREHRKIPM